MRVFLAIDIPAQIERKLAGIISDLREQLPNGSVRWLDPESTHLTMKFLGEISPAKLDAVMAKAEELTAEAQPMELGVGDFGVFPSMDRPRVLWVGVSEPSGQLAELKSRLEHDMESLGFDRERREFTPHLTVGRVQRDLDRELRERLVSELQRLEVGQLGSMTAAELTLFKSDLQPSGAVYTALERWPLGGAA